jgi:hypothetical protein
VDRVISGPRPLYREAREACRTGKRPENLAVLPERLRQALETIAAESAASLQSRVVFDWTPPSLVPLTSALTMSPLGLVATREGLGRKDLSYAAQTTAASVLRMLTAPWPWAPRPVIHGPRRARIEARRRGVERKPTRWAPSADTRPANLAGQ